MSRLFNALFKAICKREFKDNPWIPAYISTIVYKVLFNSLFKQEYKEQAFFWTVYSTRKIFYMLPETLLLSVMVRRRISTLKDASIYLLRKQTEDQCGRHFEVQILFRHYEASDKCNYDLKITERFYERAIADGPQIKNDLSSKEMLNIIKPSKLNKLLVKYKWKPA